MKLEKQPLPARKPYKPSKPFSARVLSSHPLTSATDADEVRHILVDLTGSDYEFSEGQSMGVVPPGQRSNGKPHRVRLYSIASEAEDKGLDQTTAALCVKRVVYQDEKTGETVRGVASNFLCDLRPGDELNITGPAGKKFLLPADPNTPLILVATGTGIAPYRAFLRRVFGNEGEKKNWQAPVFLFFGARYRDELLYCNDKSDEITGFQKYDNFHLIPAISREQKNKEGGRMYCQHRLAEHRDYIWPLLKNGNFSLYICGLKGMEGGLEETVAGWARDEGLDWRKMKRQFDADGRWNVEVY